MSPTVDSDVFSCRRPPGRPRGSKNKPKAPVEEIAPAATMDAAEQVEGDVEIVDEAPVSGKGKGRADPTPPPPDGMDEDE